MPTCHGIELGVTEEPPMIREERGSQPIQILIEMYISDIESTAIKKMLPKQFH